MVVASGCEHRRGPRLGDELRIDVRPPAAGRTSISMEFVVRGDAGERWRPGTRRTSRCPRNTARSRCPAPLPGRLRRRVHALHAFTVPLPGTGPAEDSAVLTAIAAACRDRERLRFDYLDHDGALTRRDVEPYRLVHGGRRWYLVARDVTRADWRTFRVDRITPRTPNGPRFTPRPEPQDGVAEHIRKGVGTAAWRYRARVRCFASAEALAERLPPAIEVEPRDDGTCVLAVKSGDVAMLAAYVGMLDVDFEVIDAPELVAQLRVLARRYARAAGSLE
ncbi:MAG: WYL domain-containing protein [Streptosporangiales bacterium]|nr:WYL domain-containing protein [Streptosporangiales bacterium]